MRAITLLCILILGLFLTSCANSETEYGEKPTTHNSDELTEKTEKDANEEEQKDVDESYSVEEVTDTLVQALKNKDMTFLAENVHPTKGVRFTPYGHVDVEHDKVFSSNELAALKEDDTVYSWGYFDGSGEPIEMTFSDYYERFVYDKDYAEAEEKSVNERLGQGNSLDNSREVYPNSTVVEYHFSGFDEQYEGMDWRSLRLVIEEEEGIWYLVGVIHDEWTI